MAGKGGGAWKVAYADFVTAMMAFFLVMWICGQDQKVRRAVSYYFNDPFNASHIGTSRKPNRVGSIADVRSTGHVPSAESAAMGSGRSSFTAGKEFSHSTKLMNDWLHNDAKTYVYWKEQARQCRDKARSSADANTPDLAYRLAVTMLATQMKAEITQAIPTEVKGVYQDLLFEIITDVNWTEIAEDIHAQ